MKKYVKPSLNIIELQLKENIAAIPTTIFKGAGAEGELFRIALSEKKTGLKKNPIVEDGDAIVGS